VWGWVDYHPDWYHTLAWPMFIIGVVLVVTGIALLVMRTRSGGSPSPTE
jgi:Ni/Fe-hydrogenase subunit HybB-like protein